MRSVGASLKPRSVQLKIQPTSALFKRSWPSDVRHYHFRYFWRMPTHTLSSIKTTCCAASLSRRRSYSSRRGLTGNCYRALSRSLSKKGQRFRSSNYRSTTLAKILLPSHIGKARLLQSNDDTVERAVLACRLVGEDAMPGACLALYDKNPSRDFWKASMLTWLEQVHSKCAGCFNHYYLKCSLDRTFAVRAFSPATISWWPTECPAYLNWYKLLYPDRSLTSEEKFQVLCATYIALNQKSHCSIPDALAQTCWVKMEKNGRLHLDEAY